MDKANDEPKLTPAVVESIFYDCLFKEDEPKDIYVEAEGLVCNVGFHQGRLESHRQEITELLDKLPSEFKKSEGGGWTFLNACLDKDGNQWTGSHEIMEQLVQLGIGIDMVHYLFPKALWSSFPGGVPYFIIGSKED